MQRKTLPTDKSRNIMSITFDTRIDYLASLITKIVSDLTGIHAEQVDQRATFSEIGFDAQLARQVSEEFQSKYGIDIRSDNLDDSILSPRHLALYLDERLPAGALMPPSQSESTQDEAAIVIGASSSEPSSKELRRPTIPTAVETLIAQQLIVMQQQLSILASHGFATPVGYSEMPALKEHKPEFEAEDSSDDEAQEASFTHAESLEPSSDDTGKDSRQPLTLLQLQAVAEVIESILAAKPISQQISERASQVGDAIAALLDGKVQISYPVIEKEQGARSIDADGQEYIDLRDGSAILGLASPEWIGSIASASSDGIFRSSLDAASALLGEKNDETALFFASSGDALSAALGIFGQENPKRRIAYFPSSIRSAHQATQQLRLIEALSGITGSKIFRFGASESAIEIEKNAEKYGVIYIEPVQWGEIEDHPKVFLTRLSKIAEENGIAIMFDETLTGFRIHPNGAQGFFDAKADLSIYGSVSGRYFPIGVLAGKASLISKANALASPYYAKPSPLSVSATADVLSYINGQGSQIQDGLNSRAATIAVDLNRFFNDAGYTIRVEHFGSILSLDTKDANDARELFPVYLRRLGVLIDSTAVWYISDALTEDEAAYVAWAFKTAASDLRAIELLAGHEAYIPDAPIIVDAEPDEAISEPYIEEIAALEIGAEEQDVLAIETEEPVAPQEPELTFSFNPLTLSQKEILSISLAPDDRNRSVNESIALHLRGFFDANLFNEALSNVVASNPALRSSVVIEEGMLKTASAASIQPVYSDLGSIDPSDTEALLYSLLKDERSRVFDVQSAPLIRIHIVKLDEMYHVISLTGHSLLFNRTAMENLIQSLSTAYSALAQGVQPELSATDGATESTVSVEDEERDAQYWRDIIDGASPICALSFEKPEEATSYRSESVLLQAPGALLAELKDLENEHQTSLHAIALTVWASLLARFSGNGDSLLFTSPPLESKAPGAFYPVRIDCRETSPFLALCSEAETSLSEIDQHPGQSGIISDYIGRIAFEIAPSGSLQGFAQLNAECTRNPQEYSIFDLILSIRELGGALGIELIYNSSRFDKGAALAWLNSYRTAIESAMRNPYVLLSDIWALTDAQRGEIIGNAAAREPEYDGGQTIPQLFEEVSALYPDAIAATINDHKINYKQLNAYSNQLARYLQEKGIGSNRLVGLLVDRSLEMIIAALAILKAGGGYLPLDSKNSAETNDVILSGADISEILTQHKYASKIPSENRAIFFLDTDWSRISSFENSNLEPASLATSAAYVAFEKSGATNAHGIVIPHLSAVNQAKRGGALSISQTSNVLQSAPITSHISAIEIWGALLNGARLTLCPTNSVEPVEAAACAVKHKTTIALFEMESVENLLNSDALPKLSQLAKLVVLGNTISGKLAASLLNVLPDAEIVLVFSVAEAGGTVLSRRLQRSENLPDFLHASYAEAGVKAFVLDQFGSPAPLMLCGNLTFGGNYLALGYLNEPGRTAERFTPDNLSGMPLYDNRLFNTQILARMLPDFSTEFYIDDQTWRQASVLAQPNETELASQTIEPPVANQQNFTSVTVVQPEEPKEEPLPEQPQFAQPTPDAVHISVASSPSYLNILQSSGSNPPIYFVADIADHTNSALRLAKELGEARPFVEIRATSQTSMNGQIDIEKIAAAAAAEIVQKSPDGPYLICGAATGGVVAFAIAQLLTTRGRRVNFLGVIESHAPEHVSSKAQSKSNLQNFFTKLFVKKEKHEKSNPLKSANKPFANVGVEAIAKYQASHYPGRVTLFCTRDLPSGSDPLYGWEKIADDVIVCETEAAFGSLLSDKSIALLANKLQARIN